MPKIVEQIKDPRSGPGMTQNVTATSSTNSCKGAKERALFGEERRRRWGGFWDETQRMKKDLGEIARDPRTESRRYRNEWTSECTIRDDYGSVEAG